MSVKKHRREGRPTSNLVLDTIINRQRSFISNLLYPVYQPFIWTKYISNVVAVETELRTIKDIIFISLQLPRRSLMISDHLSVFCCSAGVHRFGFRSYTTLTAEEEEVKRGHLRSTFRGS